jgi:hypothetical protein
MFLARRFFEMFMPCVWSMSAMRHQCKRNFKFFSGSSQMCSMRIGYALRVDRIFIYDILDTWILR